MEDKTNQYNENNFQQNNQTQNTAPPNQSQQGNYQNNNYQQPNMGQTNYQQPNMGQNNYQQTGGYQKGPVGKMRNPATVLLLSIITCGIYGIIWMYQISNEINDYTRAKLTEPNYSWIGIFCGVFTYINIYKIDQALVQIDRVEGRTSESRFLLWIILSIFGIGTLMMYYQVQESLNHIWAANGGNYNQY
ncbi:MAG: DUF4234 domain-containing protein [Clostridiaceae bacterium]|nr:DUF4234 domain-containing protein [Clostridiaceae bacterium]